MYETLEVECKDRIGWLTLNRPKRLNAIDEQMMRELGKALDDLEEREDCYVVVLRGSGRAFCAGADLKWSEAMTPKDRVEHSRLGQKTFSRMQQMGTPVFAAIHGYALGGGLELALWADFIVCSEDAHLGFPEITLSAREPYRPKIAEDGDPDQPEFGGSGPGWGALRRLPELIGKARALQLMLTGVHVEGKRAFQLGLANEVYPQDKFDEEVKELATRLAAMNRYNLRLIKEMVTHGFDILELHPS